MRQAKGPVEDQQDTASQGPQCDVCGAVLEVVTVEEIVTHWVWQHSGGFGAVSSSRRQATPYCLACCSPCGGKAKGLPGGEDADDETLQRGDVV